MAVDPARRDALARGGRRDPAALPGSRRRGADDRPDRRGPRRTAIRSAACSRSSPTGVPIGLGSYVHWDRRLDAALAAAVMSINIIKGVEFGLGFEQTRRFGSQVHDVIEGRGEGGRWIHRSNNAGGPDGRRVERRADRGARRREADLDDRPAAAVGRPRHRRAGREGALRAQRHQRRARRPGVIGEAMVMLTLADFVLDKFGGDSLDETRDNLARYRERIAAAPEAPVAGGRPTGRRSAMATAATARDGRRGRLRRGRLGRRWTSSSSACPAAARASSASASRSATARRSSISTR